MNTRLGAVTVTVVVVVTAVIIRVAARGDTPIEVADGSIELYCQHGFVAEAGNRIRVSNAFHRVLGVEVWDKIGASSAFETIDLKHLNWTVTSADGTLSLRKSAGSVTDSVPISVTTGNAAILPVIPGDTIRFRYDNGSRFAPATLTVTGSPLPACRNPVPAINPTSCTLNCPTNYCSIRFQYR